MEKIAFSESKEGKLEVDLTEDKQVYIYFNGFLLLHFIYINIHVERYTIHFITKNKVVFHLNINILSKDQLDFLAK